MSALSLTCATQILNHFLGKATWTPPATLYVALFTTANGLDTNTLAQFNEVSGNGYARVAITGAAMTVSAAEPPSFSNTAAVDFPTVVTAAWPTVTHAALMDAASGGNCLMWGQLVNGANPAPITADVSDIVRFPAAALSFSLT